MSTKPSWATVGQVTRPDVVGHIEETPRDFRDIGVAQSDLITTTINYLYDPLYRLKEANYSDGRYFHYTYDAVGNRKTETKCPAVPCGTPITNTYVFDNAIRLTSVNGQAYTWDDNGNLLNDGTSTYTYDAANRLTSVVGGGNTSTYTYSGLGDRLSQTVNSAMTNYTLDLNAGLTQVLADGSNTYLYGAKRIGELQPGGWAYHLGDALGSVRQLADGSGAVTLARSFDPYGVPLPSVGTEYSVFGYAGEQWDASSDLLYLRTRFYNPGVGRLFQHDSWPGDERSPQTLNGWAYSLSNPVNYTDPSGRCSGLAALEAASTTATGLIPSLWPVTKPWESIPAAWAKAWDTCVKSLQDAGAALQAGDYGRALQHASGATAALYQTADRIEQNNQDIELLTSSNWTLEKQGPAFLRVGSLGFQISALITPGLMAAANKYVPSFAFEETWPELTPYWGSPADTIDDALAAQLRQICAAESGGLASSEPVLLDEGFAGGGIVERPGFTGPAEGWANRKPSDLDVSAERILLQDALRNRVYADEPEAMSDPVLWEAMKKAFGEEFLAIKRYIYAIDEDGNIWINTRAVHHADLLRGENAYGAGEIYIDRLTGKITRIDDYSGHYGPNNNLDIRLFKDYMQNLLQASGIDVPDTVFKRWYDK